MEKHERALIDLRLLLEKMLVELEDKMISYLPEDSDEEFNFLVKKAIHYQSLIVRINKELEDYG